MRLRHIEIFYAVFVTGSVSAAARALNVSQPTVSKILRHAEDRLGFSLFHRVKGRLLPTDKAKLLFTEVEPVFAKFDELKRFAVQLAKEKTGRLRFAMTPAFSLEIGPKALARFSSQYEDITSEVETLHSAQLIKALTDKVIDIGLFFDAPSFPGISSQVIDQVEFICVAPVSQQIPRQNNGSIRLADLERFPLITLNEKSVLGRVLAGKLSDAFEQVVDSRIIVETYHIAKRLVQQGAGIAIIDQITAFSDQSGQLQFLKLDNNIPVNICIVTRVNEPLKSYQTDFIDILSDVIAEFKHSNITSSY